MADLNHISWLLEGVESWNGRYGISREGSYPFEPDFRDAPLWQLFLDAGKLQPLLGIPLEGIDLAKADLSGAIFGLANLSRAYLAFANLSGADLSFADLTSASFWGAKLVGADLSYATLTGANLTASEPWKATLYPPNSDSPEQFLDDTEPVRGIEDFLALVQQLRTRYDSTVTLYFRGEFECGWELRPSVMRDSLIQFESEMLVDLNSRRPQEFSEQTSTFAQWVLGQHYGLKTRFLDITRNPLVALFHACHEIERTDELKSDGRIHVFAVPCSMVKPFNSDAISIVSNVARLSRRQQEALAGKRYGVFEDRFRRENDYPSALRLLYQCIRQEKPYFEERIDPRDLYRVFVAEPQQSSERITAQAGAFLVSAFHRRFEREEILSVNEGIPVYAHYRLTIPGDCKEKIIDGLRILNVTHDRLFPGLESSSKSVIAYYEALLEDFPPPRWDSPPSI